LTAERSHRRFQAHAVFLPFSSGFAGGFAFDPRNGLDSLGVAQRMAAVVTHPTQVPQLAWLLEVQESSRPLSELCPIWVRHQTVPLGPVIPHPERHPYCEVGITCAGAGTFFVEGEQAAFRPGDLLLIGTGVPHWGTIHRFPYRVITIYFLPSVLIELGPGSDGPRILQRFTARQSVRERLMRPPVSLQRRFRESFEEIAAEFEGQAFGREIRLRTLLVEQLVTLMRWEQRAGRGANLQDLDVDWKPICKALDYLREHHAEPIYARDLARAAGLSESRLKAAFHHALGMSWVRYLQGFRIHRAAARLAAPGSNVTEAALAAGFDSLSHFNTVFRSFMGVAPKVYAKGHGSAGRPAGEKR
jgi:AraC-like DNA-binding protein